MQSDYATFGKFIISRADMVLTHGVTPSACIAQCAPEASIVSSGTLTFYSEGKPSVVFKNCVVDKSHTKLIDTASGQRLSIRIVDRRWMWKSARISGHWNKRTGSSNSTAVTKKSYKELFEILLKAVGEQSYVVSLYAPDVVGPEVDWSNANASEELARLADSIGCYICLGLDNIVYVIQSAAQSNPPRIGAERTTVVSVPIASAPSRVRVQYGPTLYQSFIKLEAVGLDRDGIIKPIDNLSYKPTAGWSGEIPGVFNGVTNRRWNELCRESVFRWYKVYTPSDGVMAYPDGKTLYAIDDILPLKDWIACEQVLDLGVNPSTIPANTLRPYVLSGSYHGQYVETTSTVTASNTKYRISDAITGFHIDHDSGVVKFDSYIYKLAHTGSPLSASVTPADLYLYCAYHGKDIDGALLSYSVDSDLPRRRASSGMRVVRDNSRWYSHFNLYSNLTINEGGEYTNSTELTTDGKAIGLGVLSSYPNSRYDTQMVGIVPVAVNGLVQQVRWSISPFGSETTYCIGGEQPSWSAEYGERRRNEIVNELRQ